VTARRNRRPVSDPFGIVAPSGPVAPLLALGGLVIVALGSVGLFSGRLPTIAGNGGGGGNSGRPPTVAPPSVVNVEPKAASVAGTFVYAKLGNVWVQQGTTVRQLTNEGLDRDPRFSADGSSVYFIRTQTKHARAPISGVATDVTLHIPLLMRVPVDGGGQPEEIDSGEYSLGGGYKWFYWLRQPTPGPDGRTLAIISDGPDPFRSNRDVVLQTMSVGGGRLKLANAPDESPLGHQDPAWRSDGRLIAYTHNARGSSASRGAPSIWKYDAASRRASPITGDGYEQPSWSPDGRYLAVTKVNNQGTDVVIVDAQDGAEVARLTSDGRSWAPVWSPNGDEIGYLHDRQGIIDLRVAKLSGIAPAWTLTDTIEMTTNSGLDGESRPDWFIAPNERTPLPSAGPSAAPTESGVPPSQIP
jgi:Tol biopolymer transport system component